MKSDNDNPEQTYSQQLSEFEGQLRHTMDDESLLQDVHRAIRELLREHRESEADIRSILQARLESGLIRQETCNLVQRMLERVVSEDVATLPSSEGDAASEAPGFDRTEVIVPAADTPAIFDRTLVLPRGAEAPDFSETDVIPPDMLDSVSAEDQLQPGSVLRDRFLLQQRTAGGSMGVVYKALDRRLAEVDGGEPWVAIKVVSPKLSHNANALRALQQEAAKGRCLTHPNIVRFIDLDRDDELYFIVMEWLDGRTLASILDESKTPIDIETALDIARQVGRALDYAHRCGVVHADVKPGNIMITPSGEVKLFDFGVARIRQKQSGNLSRFDPGVLGAATAAYSSMQVLTGEEPVPADDVFSLGCLLYRLIAGYRVFGPRNAAEAAEAGMEPQRPQGLTDTQWKALRKSLAYSRVARYATPKAFLDEFGRAAPEKPEQSDRFDIGDIPESVAPDDVVETPAVARSGSRWPLVGTLIAVLTGLGYAGMKTGFLDEYSSAFRERGVVASRPGTDPVVEPSVEIDAVSTPTADRGETAIEAPVAPPAEREQAAPAVEESVTDTTTKTLPDEFSVDQVFAEDDRSETGWGDPETGADDSPLPDFDAMPPSTHSLWLAVAGGAIPEVGITLREDGESAIVDVYRREDVGAPLTVRLEEVAYSGNRSPWEAGQYRIADDGIIAFRAGQDRARTTISMASDPLREPDRQVTLRLREIDTPESQLAFINLDLEDDDQRTFEEDLKPNTVAFAVSQVSVRESDPAVQIDVLRFNPDQNGADVRYFVRDVTATEGDDYFAPAVKIISFAPGQRAARLLIPLVQDSQDEPDEAFFLEIIVESDEAEANIFRRIAVMIRDDDPAIP